MPFGDGVSKGVLADLVGAEEGYGRTMGEAILDGSVDTESNPAGNSGTPCRICMETARHGKRYIEGRRGPEAPCSLV
jgi:hypothetical protein